MTGVYKITNLINNDCYVGSSVNISRRWKQHIGLHANEKSKYYNRPLYVAFRNFGIENFKFEVLELCEEKDLIQKEQKYYEKYNPEYNKKQPKNCMPMDSIRYTIKEKMKETFQSYSEEKKQKIYNNLEIGKNTEKFKTQKYPPRKIKATEISSGKEIYFESLYQAEKELGIPRSSICQILSKNHSRKQSKGYSFEYILQLNTVPSRKTVTL